MVVFSGKTNELSVGHWQRLLLPEVCRPALRSGAWVVEAACVQSAPGDTCTHGVLGAGAGTAVPGPLRKALAAARCSARRALRCGCGLRSGLYWGCRWYLLLWLAEGVNRGPMKVPQVEMCHHCPVITLAHFTKPSIKVLKMALCPRYGHGNI